MDTTNEVEVAQRSYKPGYVPDGCVWWEGPSVIDGRPIAVVLTHLRHAPQNRKIGDMAQAWVLPRDVAPIEAVRTGEDASVCGSCRFRLANGGGCYVPIFATSQRVWHTWRVFGSYRPVDRAGFQLRKPVRIGAWGDPAAVPVAVWRELLERAPSWTAYTHRWRSVDASAWSSWCMASVDSAEEAAEAHARGWRTFRARGPGDPLLPNEVVCPSAEEAPSHGRVQCAGCNLCTGAKLRARSVAIVVHGQAKLRAHAVVSGARPAEQRRLGVRPPVRPLGTCPECLGRYALRVNGRLRRHNGCEGAGRVPLAAETVRQGADHERAR